MFSDRFEKLAVTSTRYLNAANKALKTKSAEKVMAKMDKSKSLSYDNWANKAKANLGYHNMNAQRLARADMSNKKRSGALTTVYKNLEA